MITMGARQRGLVPVDLANCEDLVSFRLNNGEELTKELKLMLICFKSITSIEGLRH